MSWKYLNKKSIAPERIYEILRAPLITEKGTMVSSYNYISFKVDRYATKHEIKESVEKLFKVEVLEVKTLFAKGKIKRFRGHLGQRTSFKKAFVRLKDGQSIDLTTGL